MRFIIAICVAAFISLPMLGSDPTAAALTMAFTVAGALLIYAGEFVVRFFRRIAEKREHAAFMAKMDAERHEREARDPDIYSRMDSAAIPF